VTHDVPVDGVRIRAWPGLVTDADQHDLPPGAAQEQVNCQSKRPGELAVRKGLRLVTFESEDG
jgi:hypothetical protein